MGDKGDKNTVENMVRCSEYCFVANIAFYSVDDWDKGVLGDIFDDYAVSLAIVALKYCRLQNTVAVSWQAVEEQNVL